jgi:hypothetical protein
MNTRHYNVDATAIILPRLPLFLLTCSSTPPTYLRNSSNAVPSPLRIGRVSLPNSITLYDCNFFFLYELTLIRSIAVIELGAGCALPSLLLSTLPAAPSAVVVTDYPDESILGNVKQNVERNKALVSKGCEVYYRGYDWGTDVSDLL